MWLGVEYDIVDHTLNNSDQNLQHFHKKKNQNLLEQRTCTKRQELARSDKPKTKVTTKQNKKIPKWAQEKSLRENSRTQRQLETGYSKMELH